MAHNHFPTSTHRRSTFGRQFFWDITNDLLVWRNNLHDYEKPQTWTDVKALMREQFVYIDDTKNNLSNSTDVMPLDKSELPLLQEDYLIVPCNKEELCDDNTIISMP
jgi:hypothetical protein